MQRAQVVLCSGCCCGRTDKNRPGVPLDELKALWKLEKLGTTVQLSISGCLGPCAMANVAMLIFPDQTLWLGPLTHDIDYAVLAGWAIACRDAGSLSPLPLLLQRLVFQRFSLSPA
ncbi:MAG: (2Fe-2S) ferredoxin domain-containing protein [Tepidisphaera sp.]|nr:(2Fe-2S) ferredoxin domain-containing protein [Tepidisphaera sp.]